MNVHLLRTSAGDDPATSYANVLQLLRRSHGPLQFIGVDTPVEFDVKDFISAPGLTVAEHDATPAHIARWQSLFKKCAAYRREAGIKDTDRVVLLTELDNEHNWFSSADPDGPLDFFVQTSRWDYFLGSDQRFPVAWLVATEVLQSAMFSDHEDLLAHVHHEPRGCALDFCGNKEDIRLPLRTADLCPDCIELARERNTDPRLLQQVLAIMESIRAQILFKDRYDFTHQPSGLTIHGPKKKLLLDDFGNLEVPLTPLAKTVYLFFLDHPEGVTLVDLSDHHKELLGIYRSLRPNTDIETLEKSITDFVHPDSNAPNENISLIKTKFTEAVGETMAEAYRIKGDYAPGPRKITLDRSLVRHEDA